MSEDKPQGETKEQKNVYAGTGVSKNDDPFIAGKEAVEMAIANIAKEGCTKGPDFGIVFCSGRKYASDDASVQKLVDGVHKAFLAANPNCRWFGCTSDSEISNYGFSKNSCVALAINSPYIHFGSGVGTNVYEKPVEATKQALKDALSQVKIDKYFDPYVQFLAMKNREPSELIRFHPFGVIDLCAGPTKSVPGKEEEILDAIKDEVGINTPVLGATASDDIQRMEKIYQFCDGKVYKEAVVIVAFVSHLKMGFGTQHGFQPTNKSFIVTGSRGRIISSLNNRPAAEVLAEAHNTTVADLSAWIAPGIQKCMVMNYKNPLLVPEGSNIYKSTVLHAIQGNDVVIGTSVPQNSALLIGEGDANSVVNAASTAITEAMKNAHGDPAFSVIFDCCVREMALGDTVETEVDAVKTAMNGKPFIGFYTYGEQGFFGNKLSCHANLTFTSLVVSDKLVNQK